MVLLCMRVIKRRRYYYLQHSFRVGGKVVSRERYLGKEIPKDISKIKESIMEEPRKILFEKFTAIRNNFQAEWRRLPLTAKKKEMEQIAIAFTYNTNAIEGSTITLEDAKEIIHDKVSVNKSLYDVKETEAHAEVFLRMFDKKEKISEKLLLEWYQQIFGSTKKDISGRYRDYRIRVGSYVAPDWQDVPSLMGNLIRFISSSKLNPVELAAVAHYHFERIHPFGDGNGRIGRLLMNFILYHAGYPMLIIEYKKRRSYYKAFSKDEGYFVKYFFRRYLGVHKKMS